MITGLIFIIVLGGRLNSAQNYNTNTEQSETQADRADRADIRADISQRTRWQQTRDETSDSQTKRWLENEREKLVENQSTRWQSSGQPRWQNRQYIDREEYRVSFKIRIFSQL